LLAKQETKAKNSQAVATTTNHEQNITQIVYQTSKSRHTKLERVSRAKRRETPKRTRILTKSKHIFFCPIFTCKKAQNIKKIAKTYGKTLEIFSKILACNRFN